MGDLTGAGVVLAENLLACYTQVATDEQECRSVPDSRQIRVGGSFPSSVHAYAIAHVRKVSCSSPRSL